MSLVQFNKVHKQFAGEYILKDINFTIEEKDKIGLVGINGAGKSTIIKMILDEEGIDGSEDNPNETGDIIRNPSMKREAWEDFKKIRSKMDEFGI